MKKFFIAAIGIAAFAFAKQANAQKGFSLHVQGMPHCSFLQNTGDAGYRSYEKKALLQTAFRNGLAVLYSLPVQCCEAGGEERHQTMNCLQLPVYCTCSTGSFIAWIAGKDGNNFAGDKKATSKSTTLDSV